MKILFKLNHPAHFHLFKHVINMFKAENDEIVVIIKNKDILKELLESHNIRHISIIEPRIRRKGSKTSIIAANIIELIKQDVHLFKILRREKPDIMMGTDIAISHLGKILGIPSYIFNEDDYAINRLFCMFSYPFAKYIISPNVCDVGRFAKKKIGYEGYQKLAYLHPSKFIPDREILNKYMPAGTKYFLIRLVSFTAGHDIEQNHGGLTANMLKEVITLLSSKGRVYISSEDKIDTEFEEYKLKIDINDIHHILSFAELFLTDSQSMTVEAAMLGTPSIRFNSFVGKISVLNEIENKYKLSVGIYSKNPKELISAINMMLSNEMLREEYLERREKMLSEKISLSEFIFELIKEEKVL